MIASDRGARGAPHRKKEDRMPRVPKIPPDEHALRRIMLLRRTGLTQGELADALGVSQPHISNVLGGIVRSQRVEDAFANLVGEKHDALWPPAPPKTPLP